MVAVVSFAAHAPAAVAADGGGRHCRRRRRCFTQLLPNELRQLSIMADVVNVVVHVVI